MREEYEDVTEGVNQVVCHSRYCPLSDDELRVFMNRVTPFALDDNVFENVDVIFSIFIFSLNVITEIVQSL